MADDTINVSVGGDFNPLLKQADVAYGRVQNKWNSKPLQLKLDTSKFPLGKITNDARSFDQAIGAATTRVTAFAAAAGVFLTIRRSFELLVHSTIEVEAELAKIGVNLNTSAAGLKAFGTQVFDIARQTGQTFEVAAKAAGELSKQGLGAAETANRLKAALTLTRIAGIDSAEAVKDLTVTINTFKGEALTAGGVVDKFTAISRRFANVSANDLTGAIERVGETAQQSGVSLDKLLSYITAIQRETGRGGSAIGTGLNSIFNRLNEPKYADKLQEQGISTRSKTGELLSVPAILQNIANRYQSLNKIQQENILVDIAQSRQVGILRSLLVDLADANGTAAQSTKALNVAQGQSEQVNDKLNDTLKSRLQGVETDFKQLFASIGDSGPSTLFKGLLDNVDSVRKALSGDTATSLGKDLGDGIVRGLGAVLTGPGLVAAIGLVVKAGSVILSQISQEGSSLLALNGIAETRAAVQKRINDLIYRATDAERAQVDTSTSILARKEAILAIAQRISAEEERSALASAATVEAFVGQGFLGRGKGDTRLGGHFAGGYIPAIGRESAAIAAGVGGASRSARPVVLNNFAGGGSVVANTDEYIVKNFAGGGGSAIFNQDMVRRYGLPAGATRVGNAAGGYVPNAASGGFKQNSLRLQAGTVGDIESGFYVPPSQIKELNSLFSSIRKAGTTDAAAKYGVQIQKLNEEFDKASQKQVFKKLGEEFNTLLVKSRIIGDTTRRASRSAFEATREPATRAEIEAQNRFFYKGRQSEGTRLQDFNDTPEGNVGNALRRAGSGRSATPDAVEKSRFRLSSNALFGLGIGASFTSGFIKDGIGGTANGIERGAGQGALQGVGFGAAFGPYGVAIGAVVGAIVGALGKATKSVEEFADELHDPRTKNALTALYAAGQGGNATTASGAISGILTSADFTKLRPALGGLRDASNTAIGVRGSPLDKDFGPDDKTAQAIKTVKTTLHQLGGEFDDFAVDASNVNEVAKSLANGIVLTGIALKRADEEAKKRREEAARGGLAANAASTRSPEAESALAGFSGFGRGGGYQSPAARNQARLAGFKALISQNPESEQDIIAGPEYKRALAVSQQNTALADAASFIKARRGFGDYRATNERGDFIAGGIQNTIQQFTSNGDPAIAEVASAIAKRLQQGQNGVNNAGGVGLGGQIAINGNGYPSGTKIEGYGNPFGKSIEEATAIAKKLGNVTLAATLQLDGTIQLTSDVLSDKQLTQTRDELNKWVKNHFTAKVTEINKRIGTLESRLNIAPTPPKAAPVSPP